MVASDPYKFHEIFNKFSFEAFFLKKSVNTKHLKKLQHIEDFGVCDGIDEISVRGCNLDFGPAQLYDEGP